MSLNLNNISSIFPEAKAGLLSRYDNELNYKNNSKIWSIKLVDDNWVVSFLNDGCIVENLSYSSEYQACLKFLYLCQVITTDKSYQPKLLSMDRYYWFAEKNGEYILDTRVMCGTHGEYSWNMELNTEEKRKFEKDGLSFIQLLIYEVDLSNPAQKDSKFSLRNKVGWFVSQSEFKDWQELQAIKRQIDIEPPTYQEPQKIGTWIILGFIVILPILYIVWFSLFNNL